MFNRLFLSLVVLCAFSFNVFAKNSDDPFARIESFDIGTDISWSIDKETVLATKTSSNKGSFYHLEFDNKQLKLLVSSDEKGASAKKFSQLEVKNVAVDGKPVPMFKWCLNNQERHNRFLQQGLNVKNNVCVIDGSKGSFVMRLNKDTLEALQNGRSLTITLKPFRTPLALKYDISDFKDMYTQLNAKPESVVVAPVMAATPVAAKTAAVKSAKKCWAGAPPQYNNIPSVEYSCNDATERNAAEASIAQSVNQEKEKHRQLAAEKERQHKLAEEKKQQELAAKLQQEALLQAEAIALAATQAKQAEIGGEITQKMVKVCEKYWNKGEHRCYCQKYIEHAPESIQSSSTCE